MKLLKIFGHKVDFFQLLREQAEYILKAVSALELYVQSLSPDVSAEVKFLEEQADKKRFELVQGLDSTFITPYDREDIYMLSKSLDDILDYYKTTVKEMEIYQIGQSPELDAFIAILKVASVDIHDAISERRRIRYAPAW